LTEGREVLGEAKNQRSGAAFFLVTFFGRAKKVTRCRAASGKRSRNSMFAIIENQPLAYENLQAP
jgi:hypothetical protein